LSLIIDCERVIENQRQELTVFAKERDAIIKLNNQLSDHEKRLEEETQTIRNRFESLQSERDQLYNCDQEKMNLLNEINETCVKMENEIKDLLQQKTDYETDILKYKEELNKVSDELVKLETQVQFFNIKKVTKVMDIPTQLLLRRNVNGDYVIELENNAERITIFPENVAQFSKQKDSEDLFMFSYKHKSHLIETDTYRTKEVKKVLQTLKFFIEVAKEKSGKPKKAGDVKERKNLLSDLISIIGS